MLHRTQNSRRKHHAKLQFHLRWQSLPNELLGYKSATQCRRRPDPSLPPCTQWNEFYARIAETFARRGLVTEGTPFGHVLHIYHRGKLDRFV